MHHSTVYSASSPPLHATDRRQPDRQPTATTNDAVDYCHLQCSPPCLCFISNTLSTFRRVPATSISSATSTTHLQRQPTPLTPDPPTNKELARCDESRLCAVFLSRLDLLHSPVPSHLLEDSNLPKCLETDNRKRS